MTKPRSNRTRAVPSIVVLAAIALLAVVLSSCGTKSSQQSRAASAQSKAESASRTVVVFKTGGEPAPSEPGSDLQARLVSGHAPKRETVATVLTDEDCAADAHGISHCLNRIKLADGSRIAVRHPHDMRKIPCLAPGEHVNIRPA